MVGINQLESPVRYGTAKDGARQVPENPVPLTPGQEYAVNVFVSDTNAPGVFIKVGTDTIVP